MLAALDASGQGGDLAGRDKAPEKSRKAKYEDFEAGMLPQVKADYPVKRPTPFIPLPIQVIKAWRERGG